MTQANRAAAYYRKSTDRQEDSIDRQRDAVKEYAKRRGYDLTGEAYVDEGIAGDVFDRRPAFQRLLRDAAAGKFDVIVVDEPSRLSRQDPIDLIETVVAPLRRSGVQLDTASKGPVDYGTLPGLILMTVNAHKAAEETLDLSRRVLGGLVRRAKAGVWFGWICPYGLRIRREVDPETGKVTGRRCEFGPDEEVRAVRFIFEAVADRGWSLRRVCRELEARGIKPPVGNRRGKNKPAGRWNACTVRKILTNRKYVGDLKWNERHQGKYSAWRDGKVQQTPTANRRTSRNGEADVIVVPDVIPALIDRDTFARAGAALARNRGRTSPNVGADPYLFTHLLVCGDCGAFLRGQPSHGRRGYICANYKEYGSKACSHNFVDEERVRKAVLGALLDDVLSPERLDAIEAEMTRRVKAERASGEADRLRRQAEALERDIAQGNANLARLPEDRLPGVIAQVRQWEGERAGLLARLKELEDGPVEAKALLTEARKQLWRLREALEGDDREAQAAVVREVVSKVEVCFARRRTHGRRSPTGKGRVLSEAVKAVVYVRPGLGLSCLVISDWPGRARAGGGWRARKSLPACPRPG